MPYINSNVTVQLSDEKKELLKKRLGEIISLIPGKSESWLMVGFNDNYTLYFKGNKEEKAAFVDVKIMGSTEKSHKNAVSKAICELFQSELAIPPDKVYITFEDITEWGWNGGLF